MNNVPDDSSVGGAPPPPGKKVLTGEASVAPGKGLALLAYTGVFVGLPLGFIPILMRDNAFALYHGKQAVASYLLAVIAIFGLTIVVSAISVVTCGIGSILMILIFPLLALPVVTAIHGIVIVSEGGFREPWGVFGLADKLFAGIQVDG